jgi:hypothetical protein
LTRKTVGNRREMTDTVHDRRKLPGPEYVTRVTFDAPLSFVFEWCTDYGSQDARLGGDSFQRRVLERGRGRVVFEDLEETETGWSWCRYVVTLQPPDAWHMDSVGTHRHAVGDYKLLPTADGRTRFELRYRREPGLLEFRRVPKKERDPEDRNTWRSFQRALEKDYRASRRRTDARRG